MIGISLIMPVYNSEVYLTKAITSVLKQSYSDFELILVDDGSKDQSGAICDKFAKKDKRIKVIHQINKGICGARNAGIKIANGEYIAFMDNDDELGANLFADNYRLAKKYNADVVKFGNRIEMSYDNKITYVKDMHYPFFEIIDNFSNFYPKWSCYGLGDFIWNGLYKKKFLEKNNIIFNEIHKLGCEDLEFNFLIYDKMNVLVTNPKVYYIWHQRMGHSTSTKFGKEKFQSLLRIIKMETDFMKKKNINLEFCNHRLALWLAGYVQDILHPDNTLTIHEKIKLIYEFREIVGDISSTDSNSYKIKLYIQLYNAHLDILLLGVQFLLDYLFNRQRGLFRALRNSAYK